MQLIVLIYLRINQSDRQPPSADRRRNPHLFTTESGDWLREEKREESKW